MTEHTIETANRATGSSPPRRQLPLAPGLVVGILAILATLNIATSGASAAVGSSTASTRPPAAATSTITGVESAGATTTTAETVPSPKVAAPVEGATTVASTSPPAAPDAPSTASSAAAPAGEAPPASGQGLPAWQNGVPNAGVIDWVVRPGDPSCAGSEGAAWWPNGDTITWLNGRLIAESASNQICVSLGSPHLHDVALHESAHWWQAHTIGILRIWNDYGQGYPINSHADFQRFNDAVLEPLADCAAQSWGASWLHYGCPARFAHAYGLS
jgi:hypothetical protein